MTDLKGIQSEVIDVLYTKYPHIDEGSKTWIGIALDDFRVLAERLTYDRDNLELAFSVGTNIDVYQAKSGIKDFDDWYNKVLYLS